MAVIIIALALSAIYSGGAYLYVAIAALKGHINYVFAETHTFHLGLCFILSVGFLGLILKGI